jgi:crotonobetainyl-CoA:carnitine CoA-transferase CaiB-like acyl-CoA transferase
MRDFPGFDMIAQAMTGIMSVNGEAGGDPLRVGVPVGDMAAGMWLTIGILAALRHRDQTGLGQRVDTSLFSTLLNMLSYHGQGFLSTGLQPQRSGNTHPVIQPYGAFQTSDGLMVIAPGTQDMWLGLCQTLGAPGMAIDPRFFDPPSRLIHSQALKEELEVLLSGDTEVRWSERLVAAGIPAAPINTVGQALSDPQVEACGLIESVQHPLIGEVRMVAKPFQMSGSGTTQTVRLHPPQPGEHNQECLRAYGLGEHEIQTLIAEGVVQTPAAPRSFQ